ncbi:MAG: sigma-70 family RNA polymerase sigma factor [Chloroflexi bacterium]|nr:sigma-70 family RNA polymerase sigma factor [Chloroflexota bacterium]
MAQAHRDHAPSIYGAALRATRNPEQAEDVTQEAFIRLLTEARAGRYPDTVRAWLYRAVSNLVISRARRAQVARRMAPRLVDLGTPDQPDAVALRREGQAELRLALTGLSSVERTALLLAASGASGVEVAAHIGRSHAATRALMCRARARLREPGALARPMGIARSADPTSSTGRSAAISGGSGLPRPDVLPASRRTTQVWAVTSSR